MSGSLLDRCADDFERLAALPKDEREAALAALPLGDDERAMLHRLLLAADSDDDDPLARVVGTGAARLTAPRSDRVGPYRLLRELGSGGMGAVHLAERVDGGFDQRVAIKLIRGGRGGADVMRRFRRERQILAGLDHPNIARLLDGGETAEGVPYLVMDYVDGIAIDRHCNERGFDVRVRLALFLEVCAAVQFAHQRLVVHRDLKPGNILVDAAGRVKLLDFGIAHLLETEAGGESPTAAVFTPEYASPEQVKGAPVTTASDVYSLGVLLYRLLAGRSPYKADTTRFADLVQEIVSVEPERPSASVTAPAAADPADTTPRPLDLHRLRRDLRGDLDNIVMMALRKEPARRYASVEQFAEDVRRYLQRRPVRARGDAFTYRARRFLQRNRYSVGFGSLAVLALIATAAYALHQAHVARAEAARAEKHFASVRVLANRLDDVFARIADVPGTTAGQNVLVDLIAQYLDSLAGDAGHNRALLLEIAAGYERQSRLQHRLAAAPDAIIATLAKAEDTLVRAERIGGADAESARVRLAVLANSAGVERSRRNYEAARARFEQMLALMRDTDASALSLKDVDARAEALMEYGDAWDIGSTDAQRIAALREACALYESALAGAAGDEQRNSLELSVARAKYQLAGAIPYDTSASPHERAESMALLRESIGIYESVIARQPDDLRAYANIVRQYTVAAARRVDEGDLVGARVDLDQARRHDDVMFLRDPEQPLMAQLRLFLRLQQADLELRARSAPAAQLDRLAGIDTLIAQQPAGFSEQRMGIGLRFWLEAMRGEFSLRRSEEADLAEAERGPMRRKAMAAFDEALALLARVPEIEDEGTRHLVEMAKAGRERVLGLQGR